MFFRFEFRDGERRFFLYFMYRMLLFMIDFFYVSYFVVGFEIRVELRDSKEVRESKGVENSRDVKIELRDIYYYSGKVDKEGKIENRGDDSREVKYEREVRNDTKIEVKVEKDVYGVVGSYFSWKE